METEVERLQKDCDVLGRMNDRLGVEREELRSELVALRRTLKEMTMAYEHLVDSREKAHKEIMRLEARLQEVYDHPETAEPIRSIIAAALGFR